MGPLEQHIAVAWAGFWNFFGVLASSGLVVFAIVSLLPVELCGFGGSASSFQFPRTRNCGYESCSQEYSELTVR